jgi:hypothetical protein
VIAIQSDTHLYYQHKSTANPHLCSLSMTLISQLGISAIIVKTGIVQGDGYRTHTLAVLKCIWMLLKTVLVKSMRRVDWSQVWCEATGLFGRLSEEAYKKQKEYPEFFCDGELCFCG